MDGQRGIGFGSHGLLLLLQAAMQAGNGGERGKRRGRLTETKPREPKALRLKQAAVTMLTP
jgi:hypothetical protein